MIALAAAAASASVEIVAPSPDELLVGTVAFRFAVSPDVDRVDVYVAGRLLGSATSPDWALTWEAPVDAVGARVTAVAYAGGEMVGRARLDTPKITLSDEVSVTLVQLYPVVTDRKGRYVAGLPRGAFTVLDSGRSVSIDSFDPDPATLTVVLLLDVSGSMLTKLTAVQEASLHLIDLLGDEDRVALYTFNQWVTPVARPGSSRDAVVAGVRATTAGGGTALYDAVVNVLGDLAEVSGRRALFIFSDGLDEDSLTTLEHAVEVARASEVLIYTVGANDDKEGETARDDLSLLADETGGRSTVIARLRDLPEVFTGFLADLRAQYRIAYEPPPGPPGFRRVEVRVADPKLTVRCRRSYYNLVN